MEELLIMAISSLELEVPVLGLTGTVASGKDTAAARLIERHGFFHVSTSDIVRAEALRLHGSVDRDVLHDLANDMRSSEGEGALCIRAIDMFFAHSDSPETQRLVISGIRAPGEVHLIKGLGGRIIFIDADQAMRYQRLVTRRRDGEVTATFAEFVAFELTEEDSQVSHGQNTRAIRIMSDHFIDGGAELSDFHQQIDSLVLQN